MEACCRNLVDWLIFKWLLVCLNLITTDYQKAKRRLLCYIFFYSSGFITECSSTAVGVQSSLAVPDHRFTASSYYDSRYLPHFARLDRTVNGGWTSTSKDKATSWLQIDLGDVNVICAVTTQGRYDYGEWTKAYKLRLSLNNNSWPIYNEQGREKVNFLKEIYY